MNSKQTRLNMENFFKKEPKFSPCFPQIGCIFQHQHFGHFTNLFHFIRFILLSHPQQLNSVYPLPEQKSIEYVKHLVIYS